MAEAAPAQDWAADVKKYVPDADDGVIAAIVRYCGIALRNRDSSLVSFSDPTETDRVRNNYCRKKLGLTDPDEVLDAAIASVGERMKDDRTKNRVTVYYLLADHFGKLGLFGAAEPVAAANVVAPVVAPVAAPVAASLEMPVVAAAAAAAPLATFAAPPAEKPKRAAAGTGVGELAPIALLLLGGLGLAWLIVGNPAKVPVAAPAVVAAAPVAAPAPAIPTGAGVVSSEVAGKPMVSVYFDTAKWDLHSDFAAAVAPVKAYLDAHPDTHLRISGYNDPRGSAELNAKLSKNRAIAVRDGLVGQGVDAARTDLVKPDATTDASTSMDQARRVDIVIEDGPVDAASAANDPAAGATAPIK